MRQLNEHLVKAHTSAGSGGGGGAATLRKTRSEAPVPVPAKKEEEEVRERERESEKHILGGAATCSEDFLTCFLKVPLPCLGSMAAAVQPNILGTLRKHFTKPNKWQPHLVEWFNKAFLWEWIFWSRAIK